MKIVKYIFLLLLLAAIAVTVFIATQEGKYNIKKDKVINVSRPVLYNYLNDYKNWENLSLLANADTTATFTYSQNTAGKGAFMQWIKGSNTGKVQTVATAANDSISQKAVIDNLSSDILWGFKDTLNSTKVSVRLKGELTFSEKATALLNGGVDNKIEATLDKGLENLNNFLVKELKIYNVEVKGVVTKKGAFYLGQTATLPLDDVNKKAGPAFDKLLAFAKENNITVNGAPFIIYKNINKDEATATCTYSIPIKDEMFTAAGSDYEGGKLLPFTALKTTLKGDYSHLAKAWRAADKYIADKALQENTTGLYLEIYAKTGAQTRRPSGYITDVYTPIGAPQEIIPEDGGILMPPVQGAAPATGTGTKPAATGTKPVTPGTTKPSTGTTKPATGTGTTTTTTKPAATTTTTPSGTTTVRPTTTTSKPATTGTTSRPAGTTTSRPSGSTTSRPAGSNTTSRPTATTTPTGTTTTRPATATPTRTTTPVTRTPTKPRAKTTTVTPSGDKDTMNPPRAEK